MANPLYDALFGIHDGAPTPFLYVDGAPEALTHADFLARAGRFAHVLRDQGLEPGDRVAVQVGKSSDALALYAACIQSGCVALPLNTGYTGAELAYFIGDSEARLVVCDPSRAEAIGRVATEKGARLLTLGPDGAGDLPEAAHGMAERFETVDRAPDDIAAFLYTSGTTGRSKGAMLTQENLLSNARTLVDHWRFGANDVLIHALPIFHTHGLFVATNVSLLSGGSMIFLPQFDARQVVEIMPRATAMMGVPTFYTRLLERDGFTRDAAANMRVFISGSAPLLEETHRRFEDRTGHRILERYGMTETNMNTSNPYDGERRPGTVGHPLPGVELRITAPDTGAIVPEGEVGVIEVRGPNVFKGYWRMPEKTAAEFRPDGFFVTGDLARRDPDGYVQIVGRDKDLVISGGYNVYPKEVELVIDAVPGVLESAVIGVPHPDFGEAVVALVVPQPGAAPDLDAVRSAAETSLAAYKRPKRVLTIDALPRNTMGKVQKNRLRETYADLFA